MPRIARSERQIWKVAVRLATIEVPVVFDLGFQTVEHRDRYRELCSAAGLATKIHHLDVEREERWRRVEKRNRQQDSTFRLVISRPMFDFMEQRWVPPTPDETASG